jgi:hypothetical protein
MQRKQSHEDTERMDCRYRIRKSVLALTPTSRGIGGYRQVSSWKVMRPIIASTTPPDRALKCTRQMTYLVLVQYGCVKQHMPIIPCNRVLQAISPPSTSILDRERADPQIVPEQTHTFSSFITSLRHVSFGSSYWPSTLLTSTMMVSMSLDYRGNQFLYEILCFPVSTHVRISNSSYVLSWDSLRL